MASSSCTSFVFVSPLYMRRNCAISFDPSVGLCNMSSTLRNDTPPSLETRSLRVSPGSNFARSSLLPKSAEPRKGRSLSSMSRVLGVRCICQGDMVWVKGRMRERDTHTHTHTHRESYLDNCLLVFKRYTNNTHNICTYRHIKYAHPALMPACEPAHTITYFDRPKIQQLVTLARDAGKAGKQQQPCKYFIILTQSKSSNSSMFFSFSMQVGDSDLDHLLLPEHSWSQ